MPERNRVLVVDDDEAIRRACARLLGGNYDVVEVGTLAEASEKLRAGGVDVCLCDNHLPDGDGIVELGNLRRLCRNTEFIIMTGQGGVNEAVAAVKGGAYDFLAKPFDPTERVALTVEKALERKALRDRADQLESNAARRDGFDSVLGSSPLMARTLEIARQAAASNVSVLILGESGTGKEVVARAIHQSGPRSRGPFVVVNCGAIPQALVESELFGHEKGSFTGAIRDKRGLFEEAHQGTIFLDEIGEMPAEAQVRLLRVLQSGEVRHVGASTARTVDVRVLAATNADLKAAMVTKNFREDLYYRLNVISLELPPLRNRRDDIPALALHFLQRAARRSGKAISSVTDDAFKALVAWRWPGNVRELENVIERAVALTRGTAIETVDLPDHFFTAEAAGSSPVAPLVSFQEARDRAIMEFEAGYLSALLRLSSGNMAAAAKTAGMERSNFRKLVVRCGLDFQEFLPQRVKK